MATVQHRFTDRDHGDLAVGGDPDVLARRRRQVVDLPWTWVQQVHGAEVVVVTEPGEHAGATADAVITAVPGAAIAVHTADCGALLLVGERAVGVVHAGWRGLRAGVVGAAAAAMADLGDPPHVGMLGPIIRPRCYEFDGPELEELATVLGPEVRATTAWGTPALDLAAGIVAAAGQVGVSLVDDGTCTACSPLHWSFRARRDAGRQALVAWIEP